MANKSNAKRVALGMSGGVDSSVAAYALQREGYEVVGVTCVFQGGEADDAAVEAARAVCARFDIPHVVRECSERFAANVIEPFVRDYAAGLTPSPCVGCNFTMKLPELMASADEADCQYVATGHYARVAQASESSGLVQAGRYYIETALDQAKDQSYMLCQLSQAQLARLVLPLGGLTKAEVRAIARELGLEMADKPESQDICFAPHGYREVLAVYGVKNEPGPIVKDGVVVGTHTGLSDYTVGQRKGIGVAGPEPYFVIEKCALRNELVIGTSEQANVTFARIADVNWQAIDTLVDSTEAMVKLRYRSNACPCIIEAEGNNGALVKLAEPQKATAPGQFAVFYQGSALLGGGAIKEVG